MSESQGQAIGGKQPGEPFGPYEVYERLGVGGMATVHRAVERGIEGFERVVALKRLLPHLAEDAEFVRSFVREAKLASQLQHINICQLYELGRVGSVYFISMEHIEGRDVRQILRQARRTAGPPPIEVTVSILAELCDALDYAHNCTDDNGEPLGLVHRDVSPSNLLVASSGHLKIIDFGIAKATSQKLRTQTGRVKGKLAYMSPEAIRGAKLDARSDIFSVGVIAHELLTATPLFASKNDYDTLTRIQQKSVAPPSTANPNAPRDLDEIVLTALSKNPDDRFASAGEFRDALDELRMRHQLNATNRAVRAWIAEAFEGGVAEPRARSRQASEPSPAMQGANSASPVAVSPVAAAPQQGASPEESGLAELPPLGASDESEAAEASSLFAAGQAGEAGALEEDAPAFDEEAAGAGLEDVGEGERGEEEVVDIAWGEDQGVPVILDEVPDVSHKVPRPPPTPPPGSDASELHASDAEGRPRAVAGSIASSPAAGAAAGLSGEADADEEAPTFVALSSASGEVGDLGIERDEGAPEPEPGAPEELEKPHFWPQGTSPPSADEEEPAPAEGDAARRRRTPTAIGMTIVSRERSLKKRLALGSTVALAAAVGGGALFAMGDGGSPSAAVSPGADAGAEQAEVAGDAKAKLTFSVEPEGAEILIDDEPVEVDEQPYVAKVEPGTYRIEIRKEGFESWVETMEVGAKESHVIHKALDPGGHDHAVLKVESTPPRLRVKVDGELLDERTPLEVEVSPGARALRVIGPDEAWSERFEASADTVYSFHPVFGEPDSSANTSPERKRRAPKAASRPERDRAEPEVAAKDPEPAAPSSRPSFEVEASTRGLSPLPVDVDAPPEQGQEAGTPTQAPKRVSGADVQRLSGEAPALPSRASQSQVSVKLCIDAQGKVKSVELLSNVNVGTARALRRDLRGWVFKPYLEGGERIPVCFPQTFRIR